MREQDDLPREEIDAAKRRSRINALVLGAVFLLLSFAPRPWNAYAPILFVIPLIYSLAGRVRRASNPSISSATRPQEVHGTDSSSLEPYSYAPRDPKDPRKYKPIG